MWKNWTTGLMPFCKYIPASLEVIYRHMDDDNTQTPMPEREEETKEEGDTAPEATV
jgi:hypothetical protein